MSHPNTFIAIITAIIESYDNKIVSEMLKKGYRISAAHNNGLLTIKSDNTSSVVIALCIETNKLYIKAIDIYNDLMLVIKENSMLCHSVVVTTFAHEAIWCSSNIILNGDKQSPNKTNLN